MVSTIISKQNTHNAFHGIPAGVLKKHAPEQAPILSKLSNKYRVASGLTPCWKFASVVPEAPQLRRTFQLLKLSHY